MKWHCVVLIRGNESFNTLKLEGLFCGETQIQFPVYSRIIPQSLLRMR